jgi:hypothetical protein
MKTIYATLITLFLIQGAIAQNIDDNKVTFSYIQLPYIKIDKKFSTYEIRTEHEYLKANADSVLMQEMRLSVAKEWFNQQNNLYMNQKDSLTRSYLKELSIWEQKTNSGVKNADGSSLKKPDFPLLPAPPEYPKVDSILYHTALEEDQIKTPIKIEGFKEGLGGVVLTITVHPIQHRNIVERKKGTSSNTKYEYSAQYILPIGIKMESPTQGVLIETMINDGLQSYSLPDQKTQADYQLYLMDNKDVLYKNIEASARKAALSNANSYINNQFGYVLTNRVAEIYTVKNFKSYNYSDVDNAFSATNTALQLIKNNQNRADAIPKINLAVKAIDDVLFESNLYDNKARVNDKITAMLLCNKAELLIWKAEFDKVDALINEITNSGEGKARRHINDEVSFYLDQRKRWEAHF